MKSQPLLEFELEDDAGTVYLLGPDTRHALEISGLGMPPVRHWTTRAPFQHGRVHWAYVFQPRIVDIVLATRGCGRSGMYAGRAANVQMLNPMEGPLKLRLKVPQANLVYELHDGWYVGNYELSSADQSQDVDGIWNQVGSASIEFEDPFWKWVNAPLGGTETRDAAGRICMETSTFTLANQLVFPFVGPWLMGTTVGTVTLNCTNDGTWAVKPVITMEGPVEDWTLTNPANGKQLTWDGYSIAVAEVVTLDIPAKTVTNGAGDNLRAYVGGNFGTFELEPGANALAFWASGGVVNAATTLGVCWYVELLGT